VRRAGVLDADVHTLRPDGTERSIPFRDFHLAPATLRTSKSRLEHGELITHIVIPHCRRPALALSQGQETARATSSRWHQRPVVLDLDRRHHSSARLGLGGNRDQAMARDRGRADPDRPQGE
jgi:xanthine dehydrogenase YagS FAD-binding subunit